MMLKKRRNGKFASNEWPSLPRGGGGVVSKEGQDKVQQVIYGQEYKLRAYFSQSDGN